MNLSRPSKFWILAAAGLVCAQAAASLVLPRGFALIALSDLTQLVLLLFGTLALLPERPGHTRANSAVLGADDAGGGILALLPGSLVIPRSFFAGMFQTHLPAMSYFSFTWFR